MREDFLRMDHPVAIPAAVPTEEENEAGRAYAQALAELRAWGERRTPLLDLLRRDRETA